MSQFCSQCKFLVNESPSICDNCGAWNFAAPPQVSVPASHRLAGQFSFSVQEMTNAVGILHDRGEMDSEAAIHAFKGLEGLFGELLSWYPHSQLSDARLRCQEMYQKILEARIADIDYALTPTGANRLFEECMAILQPYERVILAGCNTPPVANWLRKQGETQKTTEVKAPRKWWQWGK